MKKTELIMGMPITIEIADNSQDSDLDKAFSYFKKVDKRYSPYKKNSELSKVNGGLPKSDWSNEMKKIFELCEETKKLTNGYFDIEHNGKLDPSGLVKGWAIYNAATLLSDLGFKNFYIEAGGDIQAKGNNTEGTSWIIGIRNPFNTEEIIKVVNASGKGVATSGTYIRGNHIYDPHNNHEHPSLIKSLTIIGPNIYEADRFATAAFAMGYEGLAFIESQPGLEAYLVDYRQIAMYTRGFEDYVVKNS